MPLYNFYIIAHGQNFPVSFFNPSKCLRVLLNRGEKGFNQFQPDLAN